MSPRWSLAPPGRGRRHSSRGTGGSRLATLALAAALLAGACSGPILANPVGGRQPGPSPSATIPLPSDPRPITFPADDAPHHGLTEWWYYTGHLVDRSGRHYGFEFVIFRAERGPLPVSWAAHLAVTDETGRTFHYAQRSQIGPGVDRSATATTAPAGFDLAIDGTGAGGASSSAAPWTMEGSGGHDRLVAAMSPTEATEAGVPGGLGLDLTATATKAPALHDGDGWIDFGPAGGSYYYSRTAMKASGTLTLGGRSVDVSGSAWFDHQWGDFISVGGGGWDWFAIELADGTDLTLSLVRAADGSHPLVYGTLIDRAGATRHLDQDAFTVTATGHWRSPATGADYPSGWVVDVPGDRLRIELSPTVPDQELDTRATTGVVYWEGSQVVRATRDGQPVDGEAYVELTGYGPP